VPPDIKEDVIREIALTPGFVDVIVCAVSEVGSGLKLAIRKLERHERLTQHIGDRLIKVQHPAPLFRCADCICGKPDGDLRKQFLNCPYTFNICFGMSTNEAE
jgi:hypothetical protein